MFQYGAQGVVSGSGLGFRVSGFRISGFSVPMAIIHRAVGM